MTAPASKDWKETIPSGEAALFERLGLALRDLQRRRAGNGKADRVLHVKAHGGVTGELRVLPDLAPELRQGLFAEPATYRCYVRFSNGASRLQWDDEPDIRGIAIKILGVSGKKVIPGLEDAPTQDFLMIQTPSVSLGDPVEFVGLVIATANPLLAAPRLIALLGLKRTVELGKGFAKALGGAFRSVATGTYHTGLPIRYGDYACKLTLSPRATDDGGAPHLGPNVLRRDLEARLAASAIEFDLSVQLFRDEKTTPIEDPRVEWLESDAPRQKIATLTLPKQDVKGARGRALAERVEAYSFDPWHALVEHRPLGAMMRARNAAYRLTTIERKAAPEPDGSELS